MKNINFLFRALNPERWYMAMGGDFSLQIEREAAGISSERISKIFCGRESEEVFQSCAIGEKRNYSR